MLAQPALPTFITFAAVRRKTPLPGKKRVCKRVSFATSPRRFMALADIRIRQARAASKPIKLADSNGLCIEVKPNGSKLWRYRYRIAGKENVFAIGEYPKVSLHAARLGRDTRVLVRKGTHPAQARRREIAQTVEEARETFKAAADEWLNKKKRLWTPRHHLEVSRMIEADAYPFIGALPIRLTTASQALRLMERVEERGSPAMAIKLRQYISAHRPFGGARCCRSRRSRVR